MKRGMVVIFSLCMVLAVFGSAWAVEQDVKGSQDHPLLSRMPDFFISSYTYSELNSYKFIGADQKPVVIEGQKYFIEYRLRQGAAAPGE